MLQPGAGPVETNAPSAQRAPRLAALLEAAAQEFNARGIAGASLSRIARQLFYEIAGAIFGIFAVWGSLIAWRQYHSKPAAWLVGAAIAYAALMTFFCITSFARARRIR